MPGGACAGPSRPGQGRPVAAGLRRGGGRPGPSGPGRAAGGRLRSGPRARSERAQAAPASPAPAPRPPQEEEEEEEATTLSPVGYSYIPVPDARVTARWCRVKVPVGEVGELRSEAFCLQPKLPAPSSWVVVTMDRPLGVLFTPDTRGLVRVDGFYEGTSADLEAKKAQLDPSVRPSTMLKGDVLHAFSTAKLRMPARAGLTGDLTGSLRTVEFYGIQDQPWGTVAEAMRKGEAGDGTMTLVLERPAAYSAEAEYEAQTYVAKGEEVPDQVNFVWLFSALSFLLLFSVGFTDQ